MCLLAVRPLAKPVEKNRDPQNKIEIFEIIKNSEEKNQGVLL
jgi:hypothetical protein